jgi:hypothetical protein
MARSLAAVLNEGNPNKVPTAVQSARMGDILALSPRKASGVVTAGILSLPENARAAAILSARVTAGTTLGPKTPAVPAASASGVPATTLVTTSPEGHVSFNVATDAPSAAEVVYVAEEGDIIEEVIPVVPGTGVGTPLAGKTLVRLLSATILTGGVTGACTVDQRGFAVATTLHAAASQTGAAVQFLAADAVTSARVKYIATPGVGAQSGKPAVVPALTTADKNF